MAKDKGPSETLEPGALGERVPPLFCNYNEKVPFSLEEVPFERNEKVPLMCRTPGPPP